MNQLQIIHTVGEFCQLCNTDNIDEHKYGLLCKLGRLVVHHYCLLFSGIEQRGKDDEGILGFLDEDIIHGLEQIQNTFCKYCSQAFAAVKCSKKKCDTSFHYPCGVRKGSLHQFINTYDSFCFDHRPKQNIPKKALIEADKNHPKCPICFDLVDHKSVTETIWASCCKKTWFHRECIQRFAYIAGSYHFKCPYCNNRKKLKSTLERCGIYVPKRDALWEMDPGAFRELHDENTPSSCDADNCSCPRGRKYSMNGGKWDLIVCDSCASHGAHLYCAQAQSIDAAWVCDLCKKVESVMQSKRTDSKATVIGEKESHAKNSIKDLSCLTLQTTEANQKPLDKRKKRKYDADGEPGKKISKRMKADRNRGKRDVEKRKVDSPRTSLECTEESSEDKCQKNPGNNEAEKHPSSSETAESCSSSVRFSYSSSPFEIRDSHVCRLSSGVSSPIKNYEDGIVEVYSKLNHKVYVISDDSEEDNDDDEEESYSDLQIVFEKLNVNRSPGDGHSSKYDSISVENKNSSEARKSANDSSCCPIMSPQKESAEKTGKINISVSVEVRIPRSKVVEGTLKLLNSNDCSSKTKEKAAADDNSGLELTSATDSTGYYSNNNNKTTQGSNRMSKNVSKRRLHGFSAKSEENYSQEWCVRRISYSRRRSLDYKKRRKRSQRRKKSEESTSQGHLTNGTEEANDSSEADIETSVVLASQRQNSRKSNSSSQEFFEIEGDMVDIEN